MQINSFKFEKYFCIFQIALAAWETYGSCASNCHSLVYLCCNVKNMSSSSSWHVRLVSYDIVACFRIVWQNAGSVAWLAFLLSATYFLLNLLFVHDRASHCFRNSVQFFQNSISTRDTDIITCTVLYSIILASVACVMSHDWYVSCSR